MTKTGFDKYIIDRETEYLKEKKYIQKQWICFGNGGAYNYAITADGIDFVEISGAFRSDIAQRRVGPGKNEGYYLPFAARFKQELKIPVIAVGGLRGLEKMNEALALNQCDAVAMSRPFVCQPDFPLILRKRGESECRGCNLCLVKHDRPTACYAPRAVGRI